MTEEQVLSVFLMAGYLADPSKIKKIPNEYWLNSSDMALKSPWFEVDTFYGKIKIGWRKRVINIDWAQTGIYMEDIRSVIPDDVTREPTYMHAYSASDAIRYLSILRSEFAARKP